jgi:hypothetical protein
LNTLYQAVYDAMDIAAEAHWAKLSGAFDPPDMTIEPSPELMAECWQTEKPDPDRAMDAVRAMCKGG